MYLVAKINKQSFHLLRSHPRFMITLTTCLLVFTKCCTAGLFAEYAKNDSHKMAVEEYSLKYLGFKQNKQTLPVDGSDHVNYYIG